jgi:3-oxoacyl-[acyl-carrier protein] reductase
MGKLENKVAVITGGSAGIGKAAVIRFGQEGASVAIWDVAKDRGRALAEELGSKVRFFEVNTTDIASVEAATLATLEAFGRIDTKHIGTAGRSGSTTKHCVRYA